MNIEKIERIVLGIVLSPKFDPKKSRGRLVSIADHMISKNPDIKKEELVDYLNIAKQIAEGYDSPTTALKILDDSSFVYYKNNSGHDFLDNIGSIGIDPKTVYNLELRLNEYIGGSS